MAALKPERGRGNWGRDSARGARGGKREKRGKGFRFQHPRATEFLLSLPLLTPLSETLHSTFRKSMIKLHAVKL